MSGLGWALAFALFAALLAYSGAGARLWAAALAALLGLWTLAAVPSVPALSLAWPLFALLALVLNAAPLRRRLLTARLLATLRRVLPPLSATEREAIDAGTVWWEAELFRGAPDWRRLHSLPAPILSEVERRFLEGPVEELCRMLDDWTITHELEGIPGHIWAFLKEHRFFGMIIPKRYGGLEFSALAHSSVIMKVCSQSPSAGVVTMVPNSLGPAELLLRYGTDEQKAHYLPRLARGDEIPCFALTGPRAGSDASAMPDAGVVCRGQFAGRDDVLGIRLSWDKRYITLAPVATLLGLAFKLYDPEGLLGDEQRIGITLALVPTDTPGITIGRRHRPLGMAFYNGPTQGRDVFIPLDWIVGGPGMAGRGWTMLMNCLAAGRSISLPALSTASAKVASRATGAYAGVRRQFGVPVGEFEGVQEVLARIGGNAYVMDAARTLTAGAVDQGEKPSVVSAIVKYHLTERMRRLVNDAMDVHGGKGICEGPRNYLARGYLGLPVAITVEGANILSRSMIIFGQGAIRCHPHLLREMQAASDPDETRAVRALDEALGAHVRFALRNAVRTPLLGLTGARLARAPAPERTAWYYRQVARMSSALALAADASLLLLGGRLKRMESLSARLGDVLSHLYLTTAVLKHFQDQGRPPEDEPLLDWACQDALARAQAALDAFLHNLPRRWAAVGLRALIFPLGKPFRPPSDRLGRRVARLLQRPSGTRDRLTKGIFHPGPEDPAGQLEDAFLKAVAAEPVARRLKRAVRSGVLPPEPAEEVLAQARSRGIVSEQEAALLHAADAACEAVIQVDDFPADSFGRAARTAAQVPPLDAAEGR